MIEKTSLWVAGDFENGLVEGGFKGSPPTLESLAFAAFAFFFNINWKSRPSASLKSNVDGLKSLV